MGTPRLAYFVSSHGFGHAARAAAVIDRLASLHPHLEIELFTGTPRWFFEQSFAGPSDPLAGGRIRYRPWETDVGLVQETALAEDLDATVHKLSAWIPLRQEAVTDAADAVAESGASAVVADISPLGLEAGRRLGLPTVLVENFTWDFIYRGYGEAVLEPFADALEPVFDGATLRLRTAPFCGRPSGPVAETSPVARRPRLSRAEVRRRLDVPEQAPMVLVTMGGVPWDFRDLERHLDASSRARELYLVIAGGADRPVRHGRALLIPHRSEHYHPDLVGASDAVVGKLGYSTLAEVASTGGRLGYIPRPRFPESPELETWVLHRGMGRRIEASALEDGSWIDQLPSLLDLPAPAPTADGAHEVAEQIAALLEASAP